MRSPIGNRDSPYLFYEAYASTIFIFVVGPCVLKAALKQYYDITSPARKNLCAILAMYATDEEERKRLLVLASDDPDEQTEYRKWIVDDLRYCRRPLLL